MLKCGILLILVIISIHESSGVIESLNTAWKQYKIQHKKSYSSDTAEIYRRNVWEKNAALISKHNIEYDLGMHTYTMGVNQFTDMYFEEYKKYFLGARIEMRRDNIKRKMYQANYNFTAPSEIDWRTRGYVTPVKDQGQCGSCWAFSSTGALEGQHFRRFGKLVSLSEQNLVDCVKFNYGCKGGWMDNSFIYVMRNDGLDTEESYPYEAKDGSCRYSGGNVGTQEYGLEDLPGGNEGTLLQAVGYEGPISVAIDAAHPSFMSYKSGVYFEPNCSNVTTDHAVLIVGYGVEDGMDYWLVKNSWTESWGENGYIKMARNRNNMCSIANYAAFPVV